MSANQCTANDHHGASPDQKKPSADDNNGQCRSLEDDIIIATETVDVTVPPPPPPFPPPRDDHHGITQGLEPQLETRNIYSHPSSAKMSYPSSVGGDTQPISQSVYDSLLRKSDAGRDAQDARGDGLEYAETGITQNTLHEGDTGHLDLLAEYDETENLQQDDTEAEIDDDEIGNSPQTRYEQFPESQRFLSRTPAGLRNTFPGRDGDTTTPSGSRNPFPASNKTPSTVMALSQLFNATQAPSSPIANGPAPEPSSDMPSPNIPIQPRFTAMANTLISPLQMTSSVTRPQFMEPQTSYVSLKESQATRGILARSAMNIETDNASDDGFDKEDSLIQRRVRQKRIEEEVQKQFTSVTAPARTDNSNYTRKVTSLSPTLERQPPKTSVGTRAISFAGGNTKGSPPVGNNTEDSEVETEQEDEDYVPPTRSSQQFRSSGEEDKENVDSGFVHISSQTSYAHNALSQALGIEEDPFTDQERCLYTPGSAAGHACLNRLLSGSQENIATTNSQPDVTTMSDASTPKPAQQGIDAPGEDVERGAPLSSPPFKSAIQSSPPPQASRFSVHNPETDDNISSDQRTIIIGSSASRRGSKRHDQADGLQDHMKTVITDSWNQSSATGLKKQQSFSSRVFETPAQHLRPNQNPQNTVPETSPSAQLKLFQNNMDSLNDDNGPPSSNNEEDDLPPVPHRSTAAERMQFHTPKPSGRNGTGNLTRPVSTILSSPSGRVRRRLTEIAADESPGFSFPDVSLEDFGLMTADDREFHALVSEPEYYPVKKRRGNDGRGIRTSTARRSQPQVSNASSVQNFVPESEPRGDPSPECSVEKNEVTFEKPNTIPSQDAQEKDPSPVTTRPQSHGPEQEKAKKPCGQQIAHAVIVTTSRHSSPSSARSGRKDSPDPLQSEASIGLGAERSPQKLGQQPAVANQVLAFFNGRPQGYFPATCVGTTERNGRSRYLILFEGSDTPDEVEVHGIKRLELRVNDIVKVDSYNVPKTPFVVIGFKDRVEVSITNRNNLNNPPPITDIYGYKSLVLKPRQPQNSLSRRKTGIITVPLSSIYLDKALWAKLGERPFTFVSQGNSISTPFSDHAPCFGGSSRCSSEVNTLFGNMAFAVSYKDKEKQEKLEALIIRNGGRILNDGFDELFEQPLFKSSARGIPVKLNHRAEQTGFTCLITDEFSRRYKYLQALALNLPCVNGRWVQDCVTKRKVLDWDLYLLAAGISSFLDNSVRSRILTPYRPSDARLSEVVGSRSRLFKGQSVLVHMDQGKTAKSRETIISLIYALGPRKVSHVQDLETALNLLTRAQSDTHDQGWDWIYLGDRDAAAISRASLIELSKPGAQKPTAARARGKSLKRQRTMSVPAGVADIVLNGRKIKTLDNELLCQSLILGKLLD